MASDRGERWSLPEQDLRTLGSHVDSGMSTESLYLQALMDEFKINQGRNQAMQSRLQASNMLPALMRAGVAPGVAGASAGMGQAIQAPQETARGSTEAFGAFRAQLDEGDKLLDLMRKIQEAREPSFWDYAKSIGIPLLAQFAMGGGMGAMFGGGGAAPTSWDPNSAGFFGA